MSSSPTTGPASAAAHETIKKMAAAAVNQQRAATGKDTSMAQFKSFVSETELEESRLVRQQERSETGQETDDQPEENDFRPLYERLKEQRMKKQEEFEESRKFKNQIRGLDDDEADFLKVCDDVKLRQERERLLEEMKELEEFERKAAELQAQQKEQELEELKKRVVGFLKPKSTNPSPSTSSKKGQAALLASMIKRKTPESSNSGESQSAKKVKSEESSHLSQVSQEKTDDAVASNSSKPDPIFPTIKCMGILPSLVGYAADSDSSDSENSSLASGDELDGDIKYDFSGHKLVPRKKRDKAKEIAH